MPLAIETVRELIMFARAVDRECGLTCPGFVIMERSDNGLLEIERCDVCCAYIMQGVQLRDDDVQQLPEARELFRKERAHIRRVHRLYTYGQPLTFKAQRSRARAELRGHKARAA